MKSIDISQLSKKTGVPASTLRYYEEKKLIRSIGRRGIKRLFDTSVFERLDFIALGQKAGFSLDDILSMLTTNGRYEVNSERLREKAREIGQHIKQLNAIKRYLEKAADCPEERNCEKFKKLLRVAGKDHARKRKSVDDNATTRNY